MAKYEIKALKAAALGAWPAIVERVGGISDDHLANRHGPCPRCGGNTRFRVFEDFDRTGGAVCSHCGKFGDGIALVQWATGQSFLQTVESIGDFLGVAPAGKTARGGSTKPIKTAKKSTKEPKKETTKVKEPDEAPKTGQDETKADPMRNIQWIAWNHPLVAFWCFRKGLAVESLPAGSRLCTYRKRYTCLAVPARSIGGEVCAWLIYEIGGGRLPHFEKGSKEVAEWLKVKIVKARLEGLRGYSED
jgi:hypothetical protein